MRTSPAAALIEILAGSWQLNIYAASWKISVRGMDVSPKQPPPNRPPPSEPKLSQPGTGIFMFHGETL